MPQETLEKLRNGETTVWLNSTQTHTFDVQAARDDIAAAELRWHRFAPALARLFQTPGGLGRINSPLLTYPAPLPADEPVFVKADHSLPITACVKARGGIFGLLCIIEKIAIEAGHIGDSDSYEVLAAPPARAMLAGHTIVVASTGNLGYSIGVAAVAFGLKAEVHMSDDAKEWKKARLRELGATVVEHTGDYTSTVSAARASVAARDNTHFIDDENSWDLFIGYAGAGNELARQLETGTGVGGTAARCLPALRRRRRARRNHLRSEVNFRRSDGQCLRRTCKFRLCHGRNGQRRRADVGLRRRPDKQDRSRRACR